MSFHPYIIAEIGVNHNGSIDQAKRLVDAAHAAGANAVKFQTWTTERVYSRALSSMPDYHKNCKDNVANEYDLIKDLEFSEEQFIELKQYADKTGIAFISTPDDIQSALFLLQLHVETIKISSQDVTCTPFLTQLSKLNVDLIASSGACSLDELDQSIEILSKTSRKLSLLHAVSCYPASPYDYNISLIPFYKNRYNIEVGLSDHTTSTIAATLATAHGASIIEKHITLNQDLPGPDHKASLDPKMFKLFVDSIHETGLVMGQPIKRVLNCESSNRKAFSRYIALKKPLPSGTLLTLDDLLFMKTTEGIPAAEYITVVGKKITRDYPAYSPISAIDLE